MFDQLANHVLAVYVRPLYVRPHYVRALYALISWHFMFITVWKIMFDSMEDYVVNLAHYVELVGTLC